jgi:hypothetical protein
VQEEERAKREKAKLEHEKKLAREKELRVRFRV